MANANGIGFSKLVSIGNKADVDESDVIRAFADDPDTKVIAGYLESITNGNAFVRLAEQISADKPLAAGQSRRHLCRCKGRVITYRKPRRQRNCLRMRLRTSWYYPLCFDTAAI